MTHLSFPLLFFAIHFTTIVHGVEVITNTGDLHIINEVVAPDGFQRNAVIAGVTADSASLPGPLIRGNKGDRFTINVINSLHDSDNSTLNQTTSVHWHGIFQEHTNWADGPAFVTQCPIAPNNSFVYNFTIPDEAGTYWYHSHESVQYCDGLRGPLVVYDPNDPQAYLYDVDDETTIITLIDWFHLTGLQLFASQAPPVSNATLINGQGRNPQDPTAPLAVVNVEQGKRYRFRLISMACVPNYQFSIDGHNLTVIEADGVNTVPVTVNTITIYSAQRYSFVLNATQPVDNYWVRALPNTQLANAPAGAFTNGINSAILRYNGASQTDPTTSQASQPVNLTESLLHPLQNPAAPGQPFPGGADMVINMTLEFNSTSAKYSINNVPFVPPSVPVLLQILSGVQNAQNLLPAGSVYGLPKNSTIEINFDNVNAVGGPHPFHLHGHTFSVVKPFDNDTYNFENPSRRDTTPVNGSLTTIRFTTDNSGPWFLHCHIDVHLAAGMAVVMAEDIPDIAAANPVPAEWDNLCPAYNALSPSQL